MNLKIDIGTRNKLALMCGLLGAMAGMIACSHSRMPLMAAPVGFAIAYISAHVHAGIAFLIALISSGICAHWLMTL